MELIKNKEPMFLIGIIDPVIADQINCPDNKSNLTIFATWSADQMWSLHPYPYLIGHDTPVYVMCCVGNNAHR